mmetsp:Transcript_9785/g.23071  ORF Transcript_9785/g.23071 Transcript_9785/m.23071 type:complete len:229 (-) Transcript_9785:677-1363(-)
MLVHGQTLDDGEGALCHHHQCYHGAFAEPSCASASASGSTAGGERGEEMGPVRVAPVRLVLVRKRRSRRLLAASTAAAAAGSVPARCDRHRSRQNGRAGIRRDRLECEGRWERGGAGWCRRGRSVAQPCDQDPADIQGGELVRGDDRAINFKVLLGASDVAVGVHHQSSKLTHRVPRGRASVQIGGQICLAHALALTAALPNRIDKRRHLTRWPRRRRACEGGRRLSR